MTRIEIFIQMQRQGIIPVFYNPDLNTCKEIVRICHSAGLLAFEFTNRGEFAHQVFGELNSWARTELPDMMLGIGSIVDAPTAALYIQLGAAFVVSPLLNEEMARVCNRRKVLWSPGCGTLSEISRAEELGAELVKIFPASSVGGAEFVKAVKAPCPWSNIMPTGGVDTSEQSLREWFSAGVTCVGLGSNLIPSALVKAEKWDAIATIVNQTVATLKKIKNG